MKNRIVKVFSCCVLIICAVVFSNAVLAQIPPEPKTKVLIVFYSRTGHTKLVAGQLAKKFNADLEELIDQHKRTGIFGASSAGKDAVAKKSTRIDPLKHNPRDYDIILIGGPAWFGNVSPAVRTFIMQNDLSGKKIGLFGVCHLTGVEHALQEAADLISTDKGGEIPTMALRERDLKEEALSKMIDAFYKNFVAY